MTLTDTDSDTHQKAKLLSHKIQINSQASNLTAFPPDSPLICKLLSFSIPKAFVWLLPTLVPILSDFLNQEWSY